MANQNNGGRNNLSSDEHRPSWRPHDQSSMRDDRDAERSSSERGRRDPQDESYRTPERYGQGQSGYGAGRYGEDRSLGFENRNQSYGGRLEDRQQQGMGIDDRFSGRGGQAYYQGAGGGQGGQGGREGYGRQEEGLGQKGYGGGDRGFGGAENHGYNSGYNMGGQGVNQQGGFGGQQLGGYGGHGDVRGNDGRGEGHGQPGMGRVGGYGQGSSGPSGGSGIGPSGNRSGQWGQGNQGVYGGPHGSTQSGPHRGKGPQGWQRSDERIRELICETLTDDEHIDASNIDIKVSSGEVTLTGSVPDRHTKRMTEDIVERLPGVKDVTNQLKVGSDHDRGNPSVSRGVAKDAETTGSSKHRA